MNQASHEHRSRGMKQRRAVLQGKLKSAEETANIAEAAGAPDAAELRATANDLAEKLAETQRIIDGGGQ